MSANYALIYRNEASLQTHLPDRENIGKDSYGSYRYFGSPDISIINADFESLPENIRKDYSVRKQILWESEDCTEEELSAKEIEFIREHQANNPEVGYNRWPKFK